MATGAGSSGGVFETGRTRRPFRRTPPVASPSRFGTPRAGRLAVRSTGRPDPGLQRLSRPAPDPTTPVPLPHSAGDGMRPDGTQLPAYCTGLRCRADRTPPTTHPPRAAIGAQSQEATQVHPQIKTLFKPAQAVLVSATVLNPVRRAVPPAARRGRVRRSWAGSGNLHLHGKVGVPPCKGLWLRHISAFPDGLRRPQTSPARPRKGVALRGSSSGERQGSKAP